MPDFILIEGDEVIFKPTFGQAVVSVRPGELPGSGFATLKGKKLCVDGDEENVSVSGCTYITPQYSASGTGTLKIAKLAADQIAEMTTTGGAAVLLKGSQFTAKFEVQAPATDPKSGSQDPKPEYSGSGSFTTTNNLFRGS